MATIATAQSRPAGRIDASNALAPYRKSLDVRSAAHLLRRAGFGGTAEEIARYATMSPSFAAGSLVRFADTSALPQPTDIFDPREAFFALRGELRGADTTAKRQAQQRIRRQMVRSILSLQNWWLDRMLVTPSPLQEKMTFFLHGHFTTAAIQKGVWPTYVWRQNQLYRSNALGNLRDLTLAVSKDPAMLLYLDNALNNKSHPNENYARELMELFTLGHGNYTEEDVRQSARAFTGWSLNRRTGTFVDNRRIHDDGVKTFLGRTGNFDGTDIITTIYQQPACPKFWAEKLLSYFVYGNPEPELIDELAALIHRHDYALAPVMSTLLQSNVFYSERAYRALVKSPVEFVVGTHKAFGLSGIVPGSLPALRAMGQILFYPPNVAGWPGGVAWITSQTVISRQNFVAQLVNSQPMRQGASWIDRLPLNADTSARSLVAQILQHDAPSQAYDQLIGYLDGAGTSALGRLSPENSAERIRGAAYLTMAMPAYQLS
ncbi:MAG: DUF1800 domain-containing protein [Vulcanimicrobiaceae bacterium]